MVMWASGGVGSVLAQTPILAGQSPAPLWLGILLGVVAAAATMIGWALAAARRSWPAPVQAIGLIFAAVAMIGLSLLEMLPDALRSGLPATKVGWLFVVGSAVALVTVLGARMIFSSHSRLARTALVVALVIGVHNIPEGSIVVGVAALSLDAAVLSMVVIALQNIPEGLAVATPVIASGGGRSRAFVYTAIATGGEVLGVLLAASYAAVVTPQRLGALLAVVAGIMFTISVVELLPGAWRILKVPNLSAQVERSEGRRDALAR